MEQGLCGESQDIEKMKINTDCEGKAHPKDHSNNLTVPYDIQSLRSQFHRRRRIQERLADTECF